MCISSKIYNLIREPTTCYCVKDCFVLSVTQLHDRSDISILNAISQSRNYLCRAISRFCWQLLEFFFLPGKGRTCHLSSDRDLVVALASTANVTVPKVPKVPNYLQTPLSTSDRNIFNNHDELFDWIYSNPKAWHESF